jgi:hypothetical protein
MLEHWPATRKPPHVVEYVLPDIYCALPEQCVQQVVLDRGGSFAGWTKLIKMFGDDTTGRGFKPFFLAESKLPIKTDTTARLDSRPADARTRSTTSWIARRSCARGLDSATLEDFFE